MYESELDKQILRISLLYLRNVLACGALSTDIDAVAAILSNKNNIALPFSSHGCHDLNGFEC